MKYWFILSIIVLGYCGVNPEVEHPNEIALISAADSLPIIELDLSESREALELIIRKETKGQPSRNPQRFGLKVGNHVFNASIHAPHIVTPACYGMPAMMHKSPQLEVILNEHNQIMMEGRDLIPIDSIPGYIHWYFPHDNPYGEKIVQFEWKGNPDPQDIELTIYNIAEGYLRYYEKTALQWFNAPISELDSAQLKVVSKKYPFDLRLWVGDALPPIPEFKGTVPS